MKRVIAFLLFLLLSGSLSACSAEVHPLPHIVSQMEMTLIENNTVTTRCYQSPEKIEAVLSVLRSMETPASVPNEPVNLFAERLYLILQFEDGAEKRYSLCSSHYLSTDTGPWISVPEAKARSLIPLMRMMPSDPGQSPQKGSLH